MRGYAFAPTHEPDVFGGGGFNGNIVFGNGHDICQTGFHGWNMRIEFGFLQHDRYVDIRDFVARIPHHPEHFGEQEFAVNPFPARVFVRKMVANVPHVGSSKEGVAQYMAHHIGI